MTIYVIKRDSQYKIGFSDNVAERVHTLLAGMPKEAAALGCMPGGREVEAHLHEVFASTHVGAEWFGESEALLTFVSTCLVPVPAPALSTEKSAPRADKQQLADALRHAAAHQWPALNHKGRIAAIATLIGVGPRRVRCFYEGAMYTLKPEDVAALEPFLNKHGAPIFEAARTAEARAKLRSRQSSPDMLVRMIARAGGWLADWIYPEGRPE